MRDSNLNDPFVQLGIDRRKRRHNRFRLLGVVALSLLSGITVWLHDDITRRQCAKAFSLCHEAHTISTYGYWSYWAVSGGSAIGILAVVALVGMILAYAVAGPRLQIRGSMLDAEQRKSFFFWLRSVFCVAVGANILTYSVFFSGR